ncbi:TonB-dependent receptor [Rhodoferax sp. U11-2br]|uniref:TonB-dependent siderophore receptor n=1 Tax=Rhodoferax sp. U11-2br TaxID=2838878 RepID=UPI001BEB25B9|nr:TonB-dependent receptor [Rhodoferax sp. U11-2br]MBT3065639.1 TonB-dependent receptor [Rhodoferax sp. U11-2br]
MVHPHFRPAPVALAMALALASLTGTAVAQSAAPAPIVSLSLSAQPLGSALNQLARQARLQLLVNPALVDGKQAPAVLGNLTVRQALGQLLAGSGLVADVKGAEVVVRRDVPPSGSDATLAPVTVTSQAVGLATSLKSKTSSGALGSRSVLDTPFSISSVGSDELEERLVTTTEQALRYDASTQLTGGEYGQSASFSVRGLGLDSSNGFKVDGLPVASWGNTMPMEPFERVDLLKGLSGFMYGFGAPGGTVNYVLKRPTEETQASVAVGYKSGSLWSEHLDMGGRFGEDKRFGYRFNLAHEEGDTYVNRGKLDRTTVSLAMDARLTNDLTATFDVLYSKRRSSGNNFWGVDLSALQAMPTPVDPTLATQPEGSYYNTVDRIATAGLQWRFAPDWNANFSWRTTRRDIDYNYSTLYVNNLNGNYTADRGDYRFGSDYDVLQAMVQGKLHTSGIDHDLTFGVARQELTTHSDSASSYTANIGSGNIYTDSTLAITGSAADHPLYKSSVITQTALFASDTLSFNDKWSLILGARYTKFDQVSLNQAGTTTKRYERNPLTPTVALLFKPSTDTTLYVSAVESLEQGGTAGVTTANAYEVMGPITSRQYEVGYKIEHGNWSGSAALFWLDRTAEYTNAANYYVQDGITRYQGLDINGRLSLTRDLSLAGGVMLLDSTYVQNTSGLEGKRTTGTPHVQAALRADWRVAGVPGLGLSLGGKYVGSAAMNTTNSYNIAAYTVLEAGANYVTRISGKEVTFTGAIQNLADRQYWVYNGDNYAVPGAPRTLSLSARMAF